MVLLAKDFGSADLETLAQMGVTADRSGRLRIGWAVAREMGLGGGRWLKKEEEAIVPTAIKGYRNLATTNAIAAVEGRYTTVQCFQLAATAGAQGVPSDISEHYRQLQTGLEERLDAAKMRSAADGLPQRSVLVAYWLRIKELEGKGYSAETTTQFLQGLVSSVEQRLKDTEASATGFVEASKALLTTEPITALRYAVGANYAKQLVNALNPKLEAVKRSYAVDATGNGADQQRQMPSPAALQAQA